MKKTVSVGKQVCDELQLARSITVQLWMNGILEANSESNVLVPVLLGINWGCSEDSQKDTNSRAFFTFVIY